jgi:hypothetical protein
VEAGVVSRIRAGAESRGAELEWRVEFALLVGPEDDDLTDSELELGWRLHGARLLSNTRQHCYRPWGWWVFEVGEDPPPTGEREVRLAELEELTDEELAELAEEANVARTRVGTPREHRGPNYFPDRRAIEVWERICEVRR